MEIISTRDWTIITNKEFQVIIDDVEYSGNLHTVIDPDNIISEQIITRDEGLVPEYDKEKLIQLIETFDS